MHTKVPLDGTALGVAVCRLRGTKTGNYSPAPSSPIRSSSFCRSCSSGNLDPSGTAVPSCRSQGPRCQDTCAASDSSRREAHPKTAGT